ncbi:segregation and condensation protein B [bacterium A37T11]|nr:segregation and condensation protein B [bacterium A37T11]
MEDLAKHVEALIFTSEQGISVEEIKLVINQAFNYALTEEEIINALNSIKEKYAHSDTILGLYLLNNGYQFLTKPTYYPIVNILQVQRSKKKLSQAALETLAIVAYRQPITKLEIEQIRGVNCDYSIQKLLDKELIAINGKADSVGKPLLYVTSDLFMDYFGINNTSELPKLKDIVAETNFIGDNAQ